MPKGYMFPQTLEQMKASGLYYHFLEKAEGEFYDDWVGVAVREMQNSKKRSAFLTVMEKALKTGITGLGISTVILR